MKDQEVEVRLEQVLSHERRYCEAVDAQDAGRVVELFFENGQFHYGETHLAGRASIHQFYASWFETSPTWTRHWTTTPSVIWNGDTAVVKVDLVALIDAEPDIVLANSIYEDVIGFEDGRPLFLSKTITPMRRFRLQATPE